LNNINLNFVTFDSVVLFKVKFYVNIGTKEIGKQEGHDGPEVARLAEDCNMARP
jgi:hypothetical protein